MADLPQRRHFHECDKCMCSAQAKDKESCLMSSVVEHPKAADPGPMPIHRVAIFCQ